MIRRLLGAVALSCSLCGCATPGALWSGQFVLAPEAAPAIVDVAAGRQAPPGARPADVPTSAPSAPAASSGGGSSSARRAGRVLDLAGRPLAGVTLTGAPSPLTSGPDGTFAFAGGAPLLTASLAGYVSQTQGPPYDFVLAPANAPAPGSYTLTGDTQPPTADALVVFTDAGGRETRGLTDATGHFSLLVTPSADPPPSGALVVAQGVGFEGAVRYRLTQAATPAVGATVLAAGPHTDVHVSLAPVTRQLTVTPPAPPAGMRPAGVVLSLAGPDDHVVVLTWSDAAWPASVPAPEVPGWRTCLSLSAQDAKATLSSTATHVVKPGDATWAPELLEAPELSVDAEGRAQWSGGGKSTVLALYPAHQLKPLWEAIVPGAASALPEHPAASELEVQTWDITDPPLPTRPVGATADRRWASRRMTL